MKSKLWMKLDARQIPATRRLCENKIAVSRHGGSEFASSSPDQYSNTHAPRSTHKPQRADHQLRAPQRKLESGFCRDRSDARSERRSAREQQARIDLDRCVFRQLAKANHVWQRVSDLRPVGNLARRPGGEPGRSIS